MGMDALLPHLRVWPNMKTRALASSFSLDSVEKKKGEVSVPA
jgi:hypothetical protein